MSLIINNNPDIKAYLISLLITSFLSFSAFSQIIKPGKWQGNIHYQDYTVPFAMEIGYPEGPSPEITIVNGQERRVIKNARIEDDSIFIPIDPFDVELIASYSAMGMEGYYKKYYRDISIPFTALYGKPRMTKKSVKPSPVIEEKWEIVFSPKTRDESKGIGLFTILGDNVMGTILTQVSDYRYFEGILDGDSIKLSSFDGAHAFAFLGKKTQDGWSGKIIYDEGYSEPWVAVYNQEAELENPFEMVTVEPGAEKPYYDLLGAGQGKDAIDPIKYDDKVLIIQLFGTWCPNSDDQTKYLVDWYKKNKEREVSILAASFEANYSQEYGLSRLNDYREMNQIPYDMVLGGRLSKTGAAMPFPIHQKAGGFPNFSDFGQTRVC